MTDLVEPPSVRLNAGLGVGGPVSSMIIHVESVASFQRLYVVDALTYLASIVVLVSLPAAPGWLPPRTRTTRPPGAPSRPGRSCCAIAPRCG
jgi:hypothetical protein